MFAQLVAPFSVEEFFLSFWEREPLIVERADRQRYDKLLCVSDLDRVLAGPNSGHSDIRLVAGDKTLPVEEYTLPNGTIDPIATTKFYESGFTIVASGMQQCIPTLSGLCGALEQELSIPFQTNVYFTPGTSQGFNVHYDTHDVFILQVSGEKKWCLYGAPLTLPLKGQSHDKTGLSPGSLSHSFTLRAGDLAYIPRGFFHEAISGDLPSLHITLGAICYTWADVLLEAVSAICLRSSKFREALPIGFINSAFAAKRSSEVFHSLISAMRDEFDVKDSMDSLASDFMRNRVPSVPGHLEQVLALKGLTPTSVVQARPDLIYVIADTDNSVVVKCFNLAITFPLMARETIEAALSGRALAVSALSESLSVDSRLTVARRLIREGLLHVRSEAESNRAASSSASQR